MRAEEFINIPEFLNSLTPADVGVEEIGSYRIHFEGFTDDCKLSADYLNNPQNVYDQVYADFKAREAGKEPVENGMIGTEENPILYSIFNK